MVNSLISSIHGTLVQIGPGWLDVAVGGVTFRVSVPVSQADQFGGPGDTVRLYTSLQVREDSLSLYGFPSDEMRIAFHTMLGVSGIGPRVALNLLSRFTPDALAIAIDNGDLDAFAGVPGIGKKTASRIILELKGKLDLSLFNPTGAGTPEQDTIEALIALGYTSAEARDALASIPKNGSMAVEDRLRLALQKLAGG
jgi:Holliday junction DNA helicase RuvA